MPGVTPSAPSAPRIRVNGASTDSLIATDRGLAYGDGVFRTLRTRLGAPLWWDDHYAKLAADCAALKLACPAQTWLEAELRQVADAARDAVAKILVTRGSGARGYAPPAAPTPNCVVLSAALPPHAVLKDVRVRCCDLRLARQPRLAGIKHLNRLENVLARAEWNDPSVHEGLLFDAGGALIGGTSSNVFVVQNGELATPAVDECGIAGVARARILRAAGQAGCAVRVTRLDAEALAHADAVLLTNSVFGVWRVAELDACGAQPACAWPDTGWRERLASWLDSTA